MRYLRRAALAVILSFGPIQAMADQAGTAEAFELLEALEMETLIAETIEQSTAMELEKNPALAPYRQVFLQFMTKHIGYEAIKADLAAMYAETFTAEEMNVLAEFYRTPVGRKSIKAMPDLMAIGSRYGQQRAQENISELQAMVAEEAKRIQALQAN